MAISRKMKAVLRRVDAADTAHVAGLRKTARLGAEKAKKDRAAGGRSSWAPAWTPAKKRSMT